MAGLTGWHLVILIAVVVLLFGARRLPGMARAVAQSARIFKDEIKQGTAADQPVPPQPPAPSALTPAAEPQPASDRTRPPTP
jgi:sec-independent protein translocase protein TatA